MIGDNIVEDVYRKLQQKCDKVGIGFPATEDGFELNYLKELFTPEEAEFYVKMEDGYQTAEEVAKSMGKDINVIEKSLASRAQKIFLYGKNRNKTI